MILNLHSDENTYTKSALALDNIDEELILSQLEQEGLTNEQLSLKWTQLKQKHKIRQNKMQRRIDRLMVQVR